MEVTIELPPDLEAKYAAAARALGVSLERYLLKRLIEAAPVTASQGMSAEERARAFEEWAQSHRATPPLSDEAISRETLYGERM